MENEAISGTMPTTVNSSVRTREYLTEAEIERLLAAARKGSRHGHRDATMILVGYRHGLRASELCDLQWSQVELNTSTARLTEWCRPELVGGRVKKWHLSNQERALHSIGARKVRRDGRGWVWRLDDSDGPATEPGTIS